MEIVRKKVINNNVWKIGMELTHGEKQLRNELATKLKCPRTIATLLIKKGLTSKELINDYFTPKISHIHDPYLFRDMEKAVNRIIDSIERKEKITVYGDYDVDGTTSTSMLLLGLKRVGANVDYYIPHRMIDGYGLSISGLEQIQENGTKLIISVDCGINAIEEVELIKAYGMDIIITDHHNPKEVLPDAYAIINPKVSDCGYPYEFLAGVGVAYKLLMGLYKKLDHYTEEDIAKYLDLVALGTIADIVPLTGENRTLSYLGLKHLLKKDNYGLKELIHLANLNQKKINSSDIIFGIAPRINAAGRMGSANIAVDLLISSDLNKCKELAENIERQNSLRQLEDQRTYREAIEIIEKKYKDLDNTVLLVLSSDNWHQGVIGIVASKLVEQFVKPVIMISVKEGTGFGSGRSVSGLNLFDVLSRHDEDLISFGGHKYAVGLTIYQEYIDIFEDKISRHIRDNRLLKTSKHIIDIDCHLELYDINTRFMNWLEKFSPFGAKNAKPIFYSENVSICTYPFIVGRNHLKMKVKKDGVELDLIGYGLGDFMSVITKGTIIDIAYSVEINFIARKKSIQGKLIDIKIKGSEQESNY